MSRKVPLTNRGDAHKIEFLRAAIICDQWVKEPLSRIATAALSFQQLYAELEIAVQLERESAAASSTRKVVQPLPSTTEKINFTGQGKYNHRSDSHTEKMNRKRSCFNFGSENQLIKNCTHPINFSRAAAGRIRNLTATNTPNAVHLVLAHLCSELDDSGDEENVNNAEETDHSLIFEQLLVSNGSKEEDSDQIDEKIPIFTVSVHFSPTTDDFWGACIDSGAQRTVIGRKQADAYLRQMGHNAPKEKNKKKNDNIPLW